MKQLNASIRRVNKGIGSDAFLISCESTKYIMRIENNSAHSKIKIERHEKILRILKKEKFVQNIILVGKINKKKFFVTNYIEGVHKIKVEKNNLIKLINILKKVHLYKFNGGGKINPQNHKGSKTNWHSHISTTIKKLNFSNFKKITMEAKKLTESFKKIESTLKTRPSNSLLHCDINLTNIIFSGKTIHILDWENAAVGDPLADYAIMYNFLHLKKPLMPLESRSDRKIFNFYRQLFCLENRYYKLKYQYR